MPLTGDSLIFDQNYDRTNYSGEFFSYGPNLWTWISWNRKILSPRV